MPAGASLTWQIVYILRGAIALKLVKGKASAIDAACKILDAGGEVSRAECAGTLLALSAVQLHQIWMRRKAGMSS
jgi:hypothetical protein